MIPLLIASTILVFNIEKGDVILYFNSLQNDFLDFFFKYVTKLGEEIAYIVLFIIFLFIRYRTSILMGLIGLAVTLISFLLKNFFGHMRPSLFFREQDMFEQLHIVKGIDLHGGLNSFPSGHTMSAFALYGFLALLSRKNKGLSMFLILVAVLVGLSRIYLVQHFLEDVIFGAFIGTIVAVLFYYYDTYLASNGKTWGNKAWNIFKK